MRSRRPQEIDRNRTGLVATGVTVELNSAKGVVTPVREVSLRVEPGELVALVGESGSGKTMFLRSLLRLIPPALLAGVRGSATMDGVELVGIPDPEMRRVRGRRIGIVFQDPMTYLNPTMTVGAQVQESLRIRARKAREDAVAQLFESVGLPGEVAFQRRYPHELSGGQRQRVMMSIALGGEPELLLADEPTTALDVTVQAGVLRTLYKVVTERNMGLLLVTHDLGVVAELCSRVYVMRSGEIVESGEVAEVFTDPQHPYTRKLLSRILTIDSRPLYLDPETVPADAAPGRPGVDDV